MSGPWLMMALSLCLIGITAGRAEDRTQPTIKSMIGGWTFSSDFTYMAESEVGIPLLRLDEFSLTYHQHELTPVLKKGSQTQLLTSRNWFESDYTLDAPLRVIAAGGYHQTSFQDRAGSLSAYELGMGFGSPVGSEIPRFQWSVLAGGYLSRERLPADWWMDMHVAWRVYEFAQGQMLETAFHPSVGLAADVESANDGGRVQAIYKAGPYLEVMSANGNRVRFLAQWQINDGNPWLERRYSGMLVGAEVSASLDPDKPFDARDHRTPGWLPLAWGQYDVGYGGERSIQRTELNTEIHDLLVAGQPITAVLWYESRQEWRSGDFDNVSYSISFGAQTRIGAASVLSQGQPLVLGSEYLHRSAHALAPDEDRVPSPAVLPHNSLNLARVRLQTLGWDLPYRDPSIYQDRTDWLNRFDWRVALGYDFHHSRERPNPAAQIGLTWDAATVRGCVVYARGLASYGNEAPDWLAEAGVRRRIGKLFFRYERYGLERNLARGNTAVVGVGFHL